MAKGPTSGKVTDPPSSGGGTVDRVVGPQQGVVGRAGGRADDVAGQAVVGTEAVGDQHVRRRPRAHHRRAGVAGERLVREET
jgi:hypothetical protein